MGGRAPVAVTWDDLDGAGLRAVAAGTRDVKQARRLLALAMVLDGHPRLLAAQAGGMDRQTLRDWTRRYNAHGVEGLRDVPRSGRPPALPAEQMRMLEELVLAGPDLAEDGVVRWRCVDLREQIKARFEVKVHERTVSKSGEALASPGLRRLRMTRLQPRPVHPKADPAAQEAYKKNFADLVAATLPPEVAGKTLDVWFQDEACVGQQGTLFYMWAPIGSRPARVRDCRHESAYLFGAVCPARAVGAAVVMPWVSSEAMTLHVEPRGSPDLIEIGKEVSASAHSVLVCDGAG